MSNQGRTFCSQCGCQLPNGSAFCPACGARIAAVHPVQAVHPAQPVETSATSYGQVSSQPSGTPFVSRSAQSVNRQSTAASVANQQQRQSASPASVANQQQQRSASPASSANWQRQESASPASRGQSQSQNFSSSGANSVSAPASSAEDSYSRLGGWLLFFVICWTIAGIYYLGSGIVSLLSIPTLLVNSNSALMGLVLIAAVVYVLITGAFYIALSYLVYKRRPSFLRFYQQCQIGMIGLGIVFAILVGAYVGSMNFGEYASYVFTSYAGSFITGIIACVIGIALWTMYFCKSKRVRAYMGGTEYIDCALFRIGA